MVLGHLLVGLLTAFAGALMSAQVTGLCWSTIAFYVLSGNLGLLVSAALSYMAGLLCPVDP
ncbi:hypothetical protein FHG66_10475 [Rubellimicrobium rubrum]|uniref:Uncharacterized protein n=1 Tax=Rubellimicrobium rubrum TaxID=2585369 RepID=A0A5C4MY59_9RHOB|nr:hypothetical protein [Rubellimicrobium rubrum]TNC49538.1 hypothetical protein FHG66_10475 [Rubellimicrobium rubrum]